MCVGVCFYMDSKIKADAIFVSVPSNLSCAVAKQLDSAALDGVPPHQGGRTLAPVLLTFSISMQVLFD